MTGPFRSRKVLAHAKGQPCTLRFPGICFGDNETTVPAHIRDRHKGMGVKASDHSIAFACNLCHNYLDIGHGTKPRITEASMLRCVIGGMQETWAILIADGIIVFPHDAPRAHQVLPRKPKEQRKAIPARKLESRKPKLIPPKPRVSESWDVAQFKLEQTWRTV